MFNAVFPGTNQEYEALKNIFAGLNERDCPLARNPGGSRALSNGESGEDASPEYESPVSPSGCGSVSGWLMAVTAVGIVGLPLRRWRLTRR